MLPNLKEKKFHIIAGGNAFSRNPDVYQEIGADYGLDSFEEIREFVEGLA